MGERNSRERIELHGGLEERTGLLEFATNRHSMLCWKEDCIPWIDWYGGTKLRGTKNRQNMTNVVAVEIKENIEETVLFFWLIESNLIKNDAI